jgi:hypothetical protein
MQFPDVDLDIPYATYPPTFEDLQARVTAAFNSLAEISDSVLVTDEDKAAARAVVKGEIAADDTLLSSPGTIIQIKAILDEYDREVVQSAKQIRTYVTNRLLLDSTHPDPRIRLKCYEMLGKISDVGLFTEKTEVTMRHRPTEELEQLLRERLMKTIEQVPETAIPALEIQDAPSSHPE